MGGGRVGRRRTLVIVGIVLAVLLVIVGCMQTALLGKVRELVLTGTWDEGVFDTSIFGE